MRNTLECISKFKIGSVVYYLSLEPLFKEQGEIESWKFKCHPKILYGQDSRPWRSSQSTPRVASEDFIILMTILKSRMVIAPMEIREIRRSRYTGEMLYRDNSDWFEESNLFGEIVQAQEERKRILKLINMWSTNKLV